MFQFKVYVKYVTKDGEEHEELRRCSFSSRPTFAMFRERLEAILQTKPKVIQYRDNENDLITLSTELEWSEFLPAGASPQDSPLRLYVRVDGNAPLVRKEKAENTEVSSPKNEKSLLERIAEAWLGRPSESAVPDDERQLEEALRESQAEYEAAQRRTEQLPENEAKPEELGGAEGLTNGAMTGGKQDVVAESSQESNKAPSEDCSKSMAVEPAPTKWMKEVQQLRELGFDHPLQFFVDLLNKYKGDIVRVVEELVAN